MPELPPELAPYINILGVIVAAIVIGLSYAKKFLASDTDTKKPSPAVEIVGGALADRQAMLELSRSIDDLTVAVSKSNELRERRAHVDEIEELISRRLGWMDNRGKGGT
jgi:hypothetical protein